MPLRNTCSIRLMGTSEKVETNLISYFDFGFLDIGGYFNIEVNESGDYVDNLSSLTKVVDNRGFTYWAGPRNWVYESGADNSGVNAPPQIYVNNSLYTLGTINYRDGYVYNIPSSGTSVKAEFAYKWVSVVSAKKTGYGRIIKYGENRTDLDPIARSGAPETRISLPFVSFDVSSIGDSRPYGIGAELTPMLYTYDIKATVVGESPNDVKRISDIIVKQQGYSINTFDPEEATASGDYPLNLNGTLNSGKTHDELASSYGWNQLFFEKIKAQDGPVLSNGMFQTIINIKAKTMGCGCP